MYWVKKLIGLKLGFLLFLFVNFRLFVFDNNFFILRIKFGRILLIIYVLIFNVVLFLFN